ncbi:hypothetical protein PJP14_30035, partial [Mycobacterium kansasii]
MTSEENPSTHGLGASIISPFVMEGHKLENKVEIASSSVKGKKRSAICESFDEITQPDGSVKIR